MTLTTQRIRTFYTTATGWAMPGAYREKPKREARLERSRALLEAEFDKWLAAHDVELMERAAAYADQWAEENEQGGYSRAAHSVAHAIRCGGVDTSMDAATTHESPV